MLQLLTGPQYVSWNYTYACNFNCTHCYSRAQIYPRELSKDKYLDIARQIVALQVFEVGLGGGEVVIRKDWYDVTKLLSDAGVYVNLTTNGWFVTEKMATQFASSGLGRLLVSIDNSDASAHDFQRAQIGSFDRATAAVRHAVAAGVHVEFSTVVTAANITGLEDIVTLAEALGAKSVEFKRFRPSGNGLANREKLEVDDASEAYLHARVAKMNAASSVEVGLIFGPESTLKNGALGCPCGTASICLRPNGDVSPCAYGEDIVGNLTSDTLASIWVNSDKLAEIRKFGSCAALAGNPAPSNPGRPMQLESV